MDAFFDDRIQRKIVSDAKIRGEIRRSLKLAKPRRRLSTGQSIFISNTLTIEPELWCSLNRTNIGTLRDGGTNRVSLARVKFGENQEPS